MPNLSPLSPIHELSDAIEALRRSETDTEHNSAVARIATISSNHAWKHRPTNVERFDLGEDEGGTQHFVIAMDYKGKREHHRTFQLPVAPSPIPIHRDDLVSLASDSDERIFLRDLSNAQGRAKIAMICDSETLVFSGGLRQKLSTELWRYIVENRDSKSPDVLTAVGTAIRKYVGMLDITRIGEIAILLEAGHRAPNSPELEIEVAKMVFRKFEATPPVQADVGSALADRLWEMAQDYLRPRFFYAGDNSTIASMSIEALVAMRSTYASQAVEIANCFPHKWFSEMVYDNLDALATRWGGLNPDAAAWCSNLIVKLGAREIDASKAT